jgi:glycosyltransferase involved in cell wall biosynthesis
MVAMRVLTLIDSLAIGGAEQSLAAITPHLVARGVEMDVAAFVDRIGVQDELLAGGARVHQYGDDRGRLRALVGAVRLIRSLEPDLVHTTLFTSDVVGRIAAALTRTPVVSSFVTEAYGPEHLDNPEYRRWKVRAAQVTDAVTARLVRRFHAVSSATAFAMAERLRISLDDIDVISRGRDPETLGTRSVERRTAVRRGLGVGEDVPLVLAAARHHHMKGLDVLAAAFPKVIASIPDAQLVIAGRRGPATADIERIIADGEAEAAISLLGYRADVPDLMCAADVFAMPSRAEGSPGVVLEAMALGVPTVASDIASVVELAGSDPRTVSLAAVGCAEELAGRIIELIEDRALAASLGVAARERFFANYTMDVIAGKTVDFYRRALRG